MDSHIGVGVGKYIDEEFNNAKDSLWVVSPTITPSMINKIIKLVERGIKLRIITSPRVTPETEESNVLLRKLSLQQNNSNLGNTPIEHKVVSMKDVPMVHVKMYIIDGKIAIIGSPNLGENHFYEYAEYILILNESKHVDRVINDFEILWASYDDSQVDLNETKRKTKDLVRKLRRKL